MSLTLTSRTFTRFDPSYPQRFPSENDARADLTTRSATRSNTALFRSGSDGNQAYLSTVQDAACTAPWLSRAQRDHRRTRGASQPARARPAPPRPVVASGKRFALNAQRRLRDKAQFERLLRQGARRSAEGYVFYFERRQAGAPRLGLLVTRKHSTRAVERNGIKRCIREAFRLEQEKLGSLDVLVRPPYGARAGATMTERLRRLFTGLAR